MCLVRPVSDRSRGRLLLPLGPSLHYSRAGPDAAAHRYYERHHRWFFAFFLATLVISVGKDVLINGSLPEPLNLAFHVVFAAICLSAILVRRRRYHEILGITGAAAMVAYIGLLFARLR
jgi:cobalamin synthase